MNKAHFLFLGVIAVGSLATALGGCGGGSTGGGGSGGTGSATAATGATVAAATGATSAASTGTGAGVTLDCASYCTEVMANCTAANAQYKSVDSCMNVCAAFPPGKLADTSGNTLGCHLYHGGDPSKMMPDVHCSHAGPTSGDKDVTDAMESICGEGCDSFCEIQAKICPAQYKDVPTCKAECKTFKVDVDSYSIADTDKNDFGCRMYHLSVAATDAMSATTHCPHIVAASTVCTM